MGRKSDSPPEIQALTAEVDNALTGLTELGCEEKKRKLEDILKMISYYGDLTEKMESRRTSVYNLGLQVFAVSVAVLAFLGSQVLGGQLSVYSLVALGTVASIAIVVFTFDFTQFGIIIFKIIGGCIAGENK